jgi:peptide chain release factor 1
MLESVKKKLEEIQIKFSQMESELSKPETIENQVKFTSISKEYSNLKPIVDSFSEFKSVEENIDESNQLLNDSDSELRALAQEEIESLKNKKDLLEDNLKKMLLPKDPNDEKNAFIEIRAGTGGDEAGLFAGDIFRMFSRLSERRKWQIEIISSRESEKGGFKEIVSKITGRGVYGFLKYESGIHRVQRVPETESQGRIHTSACSVAVLPEVDEQENINIDKSEIRVDTFRASGAGGQHVNKTDSAVRLTHIPSGIVVECQDGRSQHKNKEKAMSLLQSKLNEVAIEEKAKELDSQRKIMVGSGDRSEKIRTYNFPQSRVTDHRIEFSVHNLEEFLDGDMEIMLSALTEENEAKKLINLENESS